jgi:GNAT superfamily N-acetyltransferase
MRDLSKETEMADGIRTDSRHEIDPRPREERFYIEKMQIHEVNEVVHLLTDAFETNPAYAAIFNQADLRDGLTRLFGTSLFLLNRRQALTKVVKERDSGEIAGTFTLIPSGGAKRTFHDYLQAGIPEFISKFGLSVFCRMLRLENFNKKILTKALKLKEYDYLSMVVVKEKYRRQGVGSFAIKSGLDEWLKTERNSRLLGLTTQLPENVTFYSRLGFEKMDEGEVSFNRKIHYYNCNMKYGCRTRLRGATAAGYKHLFIIRKKFFPFFLQNRFFFHTFGANICLHCFSNVL